MDRHCFIVLIINYKSKGTNGTKNCSKCYVIIQQIMCEVEIIRKNNGFTIDVVP